jgi:AAA+ superfamily predicted ATPase
MGFTRAMRYAKYPGGQKYDDDGHENESQTWADEEKRAAAVVFKEALDAAQDDATYQRLREHHEEAVYDPDASPM